jgi:N-glycosidase YbiA
MTTIEFNSKSAQFHEFSNFHPAQFVLDDHTWATVEHYFHAQKFPGDESLFTKIRTANSANAAKRLGKTRSPHFRTDWNEVRESIMEKALKAKFEQNSHLATLLKSTGTAILKERSPWDSYWGTGRTGKGQNRMGALLMQLRAAI